MECGTTGTEAPDTNINYKSYKIQYYNEIFENDKEIRQVFYQEMMDKANSDRDFLLSICWQDRQIPRSSDLATHFKN